MNGFRFHVKSVVEGLKSQNSGVLCFLRLIVMLLPRPKPEIWNC